MPKVHAYSRVARDCLWLWVKMSILKYLKHRDCLPDPKVYLSTELSHRAIAQANCKVEAELTAQRSLKKKRGLYKRYRQYSDC